MWILIIAMIICALCFYTCSLTIPEDMDSDLPMDCESVLDKDID